MNKLPMTAAGHSVLEEELKHRIQVERPRLIQRIQDAIADDSNLAENSEYQAAKTEQEINEGRITELEDKLARAEVIDVSKLSGRTIKFGAIVTLLEQDTGEKKVWQIVGGCSGVHQSRASSACPGKKPALGLDPTVCAGFPIRTCAKQRTLVVHDQAAINVQCRMEYRGLASTCRPAVFSQCPWLWRPSAWSHPSSIPSTPL
jgi:transcription elongation GreA/GreB family factor